GFAAHQEVAQRLRRDGAAEQAGAGDDGRDEQAARAVEVRGEHHADDEREHQADHEKDALRGDSDDVGDEALHHNTVSSDTTTSFFGGSTGFDWPVTSPGFLVMASPSLSTRTVTTTLPESVVPANMASRESSENLSGQAPTDSFCTASGVPGAV